MGPVQALSYAFVPQRIRMDLPHASEGLDPCDQCGAYRVAPRVERVLALVEIVTGAGGRLPSGLVRALYRASQSGLIVLALQGVSAWAIDPILDDLVPSLPLSIPGIRYVDAQDEHGVVQAARAAGLILVATPGFGALIEANGIDPRTIYPAARTHEMLRQAQAEAAAAPAMLARPTFLLGGLR